MLTIFNLQWLRLRREPALFLIFTVMTLLFVFFIVGGNKEQTLTVQTYSENLSDEEMEEWINRLNETDAFLFEVQDRESIEKQIQMSQITFALQLDKENYKYLVGQDSQFLNTVDQHVRKVYQTHLKFDEVKAKFPDNDVDIKEFITVETSGLTGEVSFNDEANAHAIIGMTLYFSIYSILFSMMNIAEEKRTGTWDRLISTPLKKSQIYMGQLLHCFSIGILQIGLSFFIFDKFLNYSFGTQYLSIMVGIMAFVFSAVSLGMLLISIVTSPQQLQAVIPIVATGMAMLGGAFWPLELVSNKILLGLARTSPIYFGIDALNGAILYNKSVGEILQPISILLLMGVLFMGIGLNLMERRSMN